MYLTAWVGTWTPLSVKEVSHPSRAGRAGHRHYGRGRRRRRPRHCHDCRRRGVGGRRRRGAGVAGEVQGGRRVAACVVGASPSVLLLALTHKVVAGDSLPKREFHEINSVELLNSCTFD